MPKTRSELRNSTLVSVLVMRLRGRWYVFSDAPITIPNTRTTDDLFPSTLVSYGGLTPVTFNDTAKIATQAIQTGAINLEVFFQGDNVTGWLALAQDDQDLGDSTAELALVRVAPDGTVDDWTERQTLAAGYVDSPRWGRAFEPVSFTLRTDPIEDRARFPPDSARVDETTWPRSNSSGVSRDERIYGAMYPWVFGSPGFLSGDEGFTTFPGSIAYIVEISTADGDNSNTPAILLIAGHETVAGAQTADVVIFNQTTGNTATVSAAHATDERGRRVTIASVASGDMTITAGDETWVAWRTTDVFPNLSRRFGGLPSRSGEQSERNAASIIRYLLGFSTVRYDPGSVENMEQLLQGYFLDFFINEQKSPMEHILDDITHLLPVSTRVGERGLNFITWQLDAEVEDAVMVLDADRGDCELAGPLTRSTTQDIVNDLRINFALRPDTGRWLRYLRASPFDETDTFTFTDVRAKASYTRYKLPDGSSRAGEPINTDAIVSAGTARAVLAWRILLDAGTRIDVDYQLQQEGQSLQPGDVVLLTDSEVGFSERLAHVRRVTRAPGDTIITLTILQDWIRDSQPRS